MLAKDIKNLFEKGAGFYDFANSLLSFGIDDLWRKEVARSIKTSNGRVADIATGTAKVAIKIAKRNPNLEVVGIDFSPQMLELGVKRIRKLKLNNKVFLLIGDGCALPLGSESFDAITVVFGIRNMTERESALNEFYSILKPGGQLIIMEFGFPKIPVFRPLYLFYFNHILPRLGNLLLPWGNAYTYLRDSVHKFPSPENFAGMLQAARFTEVNVKPLTGGIVNLFQAVKN